MGTTTLTLDSDSLTALVELELDLLLLPQANSASGSNPPKKYLLNLFLVYIVLGFPKLLLFDKTLKLYLIKVYFLLLNIIV